MVTVLIITRYLLWEAHRSIFLYTTAEYSAKYEYLDFLHSSYVDSVKTVKIYFRLKLCKHLIVFLDLFLSDLLTHLPRLREIYYIITFCYFSSHCPEFLNPSHELFIYKNIITGEKVDMNVLTTTNLIQSIIGSLLLPSLVG